MKQQCAGGIGRTRRIKEIRRKREFLSLSFSLARVRARKASRTKPEEMAREARSKKEENKPKFRSSKHEKL